MEKFPEFSNKFNEKMSQEIETISSDFNLPKTKKDFFSGNYSFDPFLTTEKKGRWEKTYVIDDITTNAAELYFNKKFQELLPRRNSMGILEIKNPLTGEYEQFSVKKFSEISGVSMVVYDYTKGKNALPLSISERQGGGREFAHRFFNNLLENKIISLSDFKETRPKKSLLNSPEQERNFKENGANEFLLSNKSGSAMYYLGKKKIVGTDIEINPQSMSLMQLDKNLFAILEKDIFGKKKILFTFPGITQEEKDFLVKNLQRKKDVSVSEMPIYLRVPMEGRLRPYKNEQNKNIDTVLTSVRSFFVENNISVSDVLWSEQIQLTELLSKLSYDKRSSLKRFLDVYKVEGLRTFLSLEHGGQEMGDKILSLGERFKEDPEIARNIFSKYSEIIDSADSIFENITSYFKKEIALSPESINKIKDSLYKRGADLLIRFEAEKNMAPDKVLVELENIHTDTIATLSVFKQTLRSGSSYSLEDIIGAEFRKRSGEEYTKQEVKEMVSIYKNNWKNFEPQEIMQEIIKKFEESLTGVDAPKNEVYTFSHEGTINAFVKFADLGTGVKYASALNVDSTLHGLSLGEAMMDEALAKEAQTSVLCAMCESNKDSAMRYFEKGFIATGFSPEVPPFLDIWWNEKENALLISKKLSPEELVGMYLKDEIPQSLTIKKGETLEALHSTFPEGKCLTRCFKNPAGTGWYAVYEKVPASYQSARLSQD